MTKRLESKDDALTDAAWDAITALERDYYTQEYRSAAALKLRLALRSESRALEKREGEKPGGFEELFRESLNAEGPRSASRPITREVDLAARLHAHAEEIRTSKNWSAYVADELEEAARLLEARSSSAAPTGWKLVPEEPTQEMQMEGMKEDDRYSNNRFTFPSESRQYTVYRAMIDAAPAAPVSATEDSKDAARWRALKELAGYYQDGSQTTVKLYQDDALRSCFIEAGKKTYGTDGSSFNSAIDEAMRATTDRRGA